MNQLESYKKWMAVIDNFKRSDYEAWFKFAMLWFSFNGYYSERYSHIRGERNQLIEFAKDNKNLYESLLSDKQGFKNILDKFAETQHPDRTSVRDMRPNSQQSVKFNSNNKSCEDFLNVLYQIRCNFFHGDKLPFYEKDKKLIHWAFKYFKIFWERFLERNEN